MEEASKAVRVLIIDDHGTMRKIIRQLLHQVGINDVIEAENGEVALEILQHPQIKDPDVIICDLHMDKMDGTEFCNSLRRDKNLRNRHIPIIILTGDDNDLLHEVTLQLGVAAIVTKPVSAPDLMTHIAKAVGFNMAG